MVALTSLRRLGARRLAEDFDALVAGRPRVDRYELFATARRRAPLFYSRSLRAWVVSRYDDVRAVLEDASAFDLVRDGPGMSILSGGFTAWRGREHGKKMGIVARRIRSPRALQHEVGARVGLVAAELADQLRLGEEIDLRDRYAKRLPLRVICELTGIEEAEWLRDWYERMMAEATGARGYDAVRVAGLRAVGELREILGPTLAERRREPRGDLVSDLLHASYDGEPLPDEEVVMVVAQLYAATMETTERVLTSAFRHLANDPALYAQLRDRRRDDLALASFGAEALRIYPPIQANMRTAIAPAVVAGRRFAAGEVAVALLASANRDERRFARAGDFDAGRFAHNPDRQYTAAGDILPFGAGERHCVGSRLARVFIVEALRQLMDRAGRIELQEPGQDVGGLVFWSPDSLRVRLLPPS